MTGAGDGDRTHVCSLGSCRSTIELHPRGCAFYVLSLQYSNTITMIPQSSYSFLKWCDMVGILLEDCVKYYCGAITGITGVAIRIAQIIFIF